MRGKRNTDHIEELRRDHDKLAATVETDLNEDRERWAGQKEWNLRMELGGSQEETATAIAQAVAQEIGAHAPLTAPVNIWAYWKLIAAVVILLLAAGPLACAAMLAAYIGPATLADIAEACTK